MTNNDILRRIRYALNIKDSAIVEIFLLADYKIDVKTALNLLRKEEESGFIECSDEALSCFLDGLISSKRGKRCNVDSTSVMQETRLNNNDILKKLRIALQLKDEDIVEILKTANFRISKSELGALFRKKGHKNYKECGNQFLRNFLVGLTTKYRKKS